jgi:3-deoxy-D-manno-octulosonate 8-phosphate phosphatase (KDO 8-P phosphatase)
VSEIEDHALGQLARNIKLCLFDVDGVLTDGKIILGSGNTELKAFDVKDGQGLVMLREFVEVGVITGRKSEAVRERMSQLGIKHVFQGQKNKPAALVQLLEMLNLQPSEVCYVGDDLPDLAVMQLVGLPIAVADACTPVREAARWCTIRRGGDGAVREVCDFILNAQGKLDSLVARAAVAQIPVDQNN